MCVGFLLRYIHVKVRIRDGVNSTHHSFLSEDSPHSTILEACPAAYYVHVMEIQKIPPPSNDTDEEEREKYMRNGTFL